MTRRTVGRIAAAAAIALSLSGCMKVTAELTLKPNNTVDGTMILAMNKSLAQLTGQDPKALADELNKGMLDGDNHPKTARTEAYSDDTFVGTKITFLDEPITTFQGGSASPSASPTADASSTDGLKIVREGDDFVVTGSLDTTTAGAGLGTSTDMSAFTNGAQLLVAITFPGEVKQHNGTLKGRTVTWTPKLGERVSMNARGSALGGFAIPVWLWAVGAVVLVLLGLLIGLLLSRRRTSAPVDAEVPYTAVGDPSVVYSPDVYTPDAYTPGATPPAQAPGLAPPVEPPNPPAEPPVPPVAPPV